MSLFNSCCCWGKMRRMEGRQRKSRTRSTDRIGVYLMWESMKFVGFTQYVRDVFTFCLISVSHVLVNVSLLPLEPHPQERRVLSATDSRSREQDCWCWSGAYDADKRARRLFLSLAIEELDMGWGIPVVSMSERQNANVTKTSIALRSPYSPASEMSKRIKHKLLLHLKFMIRPIPWLNWNNRYQLFMKRQSFLQLFHHCLPDFLQLALTDCVIRQ